MNQNRENIFDITLGLFSLILTLILTLFNKEYIYINISLFIILLIQGILLRKIQLRIGQFNITFYIVSIILSYFILGLVPTLWLIIIIFYFYEVFTDKSRKIVAMSNAGMFIVIFILLHYAVKILGYNHYKDLNSIYNAIFIIMFSVSVFLLNWIFIFIQFRVIDNKMPEGWTEGLVWDFYSNIITVPLTVILIDFYYTYNYIAIVILSLLIIFANMLFKLVRNIVFLNSQLKIVHEIAVSVSSELELGEVTSNILQGIYDLVKYDYCLLLRFDEDINNVEIMDSKTFKSLEIDDCDIQKYIIDNINRISKYKESFIAGEARGSKYYLDLSEVSNEIISSIYQPLLVKNQLIGCILLSSNKSNTFLEEHLTVLSILASQAAIAIENAKLYKETKNRAIKDALTGLYNQSYFFSSLEAITGGCLTCDRNRCIPCRTTSLIILDIDHFKKINDTYGHQAGDKILKDVSQIIKRNVRKTDITSRYGGEEFTIILPQTDENTAYIIAERIRLGIEQTNFETIDGQTINITISGGVSEFPKQADSGTTLLAYADRAMYTGSKRRGRNKISKYVG